VSNLPSTLHDVATPHRVEILDRLRETEFDLLVIGGGITGVGVALDAASRGLSTALIERGDFASGTSSKSSKLVHGGLRYLQNGEIRLVYEALRERQRLMRNAPHLVQVLPFLIPILTRDGVISKRIAKALGSAMWMYDLTGGWRIGKRHRRVDATTAQAHFPTADPERLSGGFLYYDAAADDARLTLAIARTAVAHGATVLNHCELIALSCETAGPITCAEVRAVDAHGDAEEFSIRARCVVNATGVWADEIAAIENPSTAPRVRPAKGIHITVPWDKIRNDIAVVIPVPQDKRSLFIVPWGPRADGGFDYAYVGTTDTDYAGPLDDPHTEAQDVEYVLRALNAAVTSHISTDDVLGVWSGLRPLVRDDGAKTGRTADLSRHHAISISAGGVISITGGKLTTYRLMASDCVDVVLKSLGTAPWKVRLMRRSRTRRLCLIGGDASLRARSTQDSEAAHLWGRYGTEREQIAKIINERPELGQRLHPALAHLGAEVVFAVRSEMALSVADVCERRFRTHIFHRAVSEQIAPLVAEIMGTELGWTPAEQQRSLAEYLQICAAERLAAQR
jgi:glycerol-3-phosphate dehydrogenase